MVAWFFDAMAGEKRKEKECELGSFYSPSIDSWAESVTTMWVVKQLQHWTLTWAQSRCQGMFYLFIQIIIRLIRRQMQWTAATFHRRQE